jgi:hypothetical protein
MFAPITPRTKSPSTKHEVKQDWEKLYRRPSSSLTGASCCVDPRAKGGWAVAAIIPKTLAGHTDVWPLF